MKLFRSIFTFFIVLSLAPVLQAAEPPLARVDGSFTLVVMPDTQIYAWKFPHHFLRQTEWIAENVDKLNIKFVLHEGDIVQNNADSEWQIASKAMSKLDGVVPYALVPGNHDYGPGGSAKTRETLLNKYFKVHRYESMPTFQGVMEAEKMDNSYHTFAAGGKDYLVLALEWGPRGKTVAWANEIAAKHPKHQTILLTHAYLYSDNTRYDWADKEMKQNWNPHAYSDKVEVHDGQELWDQLVRKHKQFFLTLNGHVLHDGQARLTSQGDAGNRVHQILTNFQMRKEGGQGYLRLMEFPPDGKSIRCTTYSPSLDHWLTDDQNQFILELDP